MAKMLGEFEEPSVKPRYSIDEELGIIGDVFLPGVRRSVGSMVMVDIRVEQGDV